MPIKYPLNHHSYPEKNHHHQTAALERPHLWTNVIRARDPPAALPCGRFRNQQKDWGALRPISGENQWDFVDFEWINGIIAPRKITCSMDSFMEKSAETCRKRVW